MDKKRLNLLINGPESLSKEDYQQLLTLRNDYPYMQCIQPLLVIGSQNFDQEEFKNHLQTAAIYSLDRSQLKSFLSSHKKDISNDQEKTTATTPVHSDIIPESPISSPSENYTHLPDQFFEELNADMSNLKRAKEAYNKTIQKIEEEAKKSIESKTKGTSKRTSKDKPSNKKEPVKAVKNTSSKTKATATNKKEPLKKKTNKKSSKSEPIHHSILEEIKLKEIKAISDEHLMEQINLITSFIEKEPSINKKMLDNSVDAKRVLEDLSESSTHLSDDVISETLAKLMIKQGRKEKAIDIYKKLIWKFPQKKAYFADQIKNLKIEE